MSDAHAVVPFASGATSVSYSLSHDVDYESWSTCLSTACMTERASGWWIGDLLNHGQEHFGELWSQAIPDDYHPSTLMDYPRVAGAIPPEERRAEVSFNHHRAVVACDSETRAQLLNEAIANNWSVKDIRDAKRDALPPADSDAEVDSVIDGDVPEDAVWSGTMVVKGPINVAEGATLTLAPGTKVHFV